MCGAVWGGRQGGVCGVDDQPVGCRHAVEADGGDTRGKAPLALVCAVIDVWETVDLAGVWRW